MKKRISTIVSLLFIIFSQHSYSQTYSFAGNIGGKFIYDASGNVYVTGSFTGTVDFDPGVGVKNLTAPSGVREMFVAKYDVSGNYIFAKSTAGSLASDPLFYQDIYSGTFTEPSDIKIDNLGNICIIGEFRGVVDFDMDSGISKLTSTSDHPMFITKYNSSGELLYAKCTESIYGLRNYNTVKPNNFFITPSNEIYVVGRFSGKIDFAPNTESIILAAPESNIDFGTVIGGTSQPHFDYDIFIAKYDASGNCVFAKQIKSDYSNNFGDGYTYEYGNSITGVTLDNIGDLCISGKFRGTTDFDPGVGVKNLSTGLEANVFLAKYDASGNCVFAKSMGGSNNLYISNNCLSVDSNKNIYFGGSFSGIVDFDPSENTQSLSAVGSYTGTSGKTDIFIAKYDPLGNYISVKQIESYAPNEGLTYTSFGGITLDNENNLYISGSFIGYTNSSLDFDPSTSVQSLSPKYLGNPDIFIAKYDPAGNYISVNQIPVESNIYNAGSNTTYDLKVDSYKNIYITGRISQNMDFGVGTTPKIVTPNDTKSFLAKYNQRLSQTIIFPTIPNKTYGDAPFTLAATASSGLPITYVSSNPLIATISGNVVTILGVGVVNITASQGGNENYNPATNVSQTLTINKSNQTIIFNAIVNKTYGDTPFTVTATASSGLPVTYVSSNPLIATVSGNIVTILKAGVVNIIASQAGNENYNSATNVSQTLTINKKDQTITFNPIPNKIYGDAPFTVTATATSGLPATYVSSNPLIATVSGNVVTILGVGVVDIIASQAGNENYNSAINISQTLTINKKDQTITFNTIPNKTYGDAPFTVTATASSGLPITYTSSNPLIATVLGNVVTILRAGVVDIIASQAGNETYNPAINISQTLTINKKNQTITFNTIPNKTYGDAPFTVNATASSGLPVTYTSSNPLIATISGNVVTILGAGVVNIITSQAGNENYNPVPQFQFDAILVVEKANLTLAFKDLKDTIQYVPRKLTYGQTLDYMFNVKSIEQIGEISDYELNNLTRLTSSDPFVIDFSLNIIYDLGPVTVTANFKGNDNYNAISISKSIVIVKAKQQLTILNSYNNITAWYGDNYSLLRNYFVLNSNLTPKFTLEDPKIASVEPDGRLKILDIGQTNIIVSHPGSYFYEPLPPTLIPLKVLGSSPTSKPVARDILSYSYDGIFGESVDKSTFYSNRFNNIFFDDLGRAFVQEDYYVRPKNRSTITMIDEKQCFISSNTYWKNNGLTLLDPGYYSQEQTSYLILLGTSGNNCHVNSPNSRENFIFDENFNVIHKYPSSDMNPACIINNKAYSLERYISATSFINKTRMMVFDISNTNSGKLLKTLPFSPSNDPNDWLVGSSVMRSDGNSIYILRAISLTKGPYEGGGYKTMLQKFDTLGNLLKELEFPEPFLPESFELVSKNKQLAVVSSAKIYLVSDNLEFAQNAKPNTNNIKGIAYNKATNETMVYRNNGGIIYRYDLENNTQTQYLPLPLDSGKVNYGSVMTVYKDKIYQFDYKYLRAYSLQGVLSKKILLKTQSLYVSQPFKILILNDIIYIAYQFSDYPHIESFDMQGNSLKIIKIEDKNFKDVDIDTELNIYTLRVYYNNSCLIKKYDSNGVFVKDFSLKTKDCQFLSVDEDKSFYISSSSSTNVDKYDPNGVFLFTTSKPSFSSATDLLFDLVVANHKIYVVHSRSFPNIENFITMFDATIGIELGHLGNLQPSSTPNNYYSASVAVSEDGNVYAGTSGNVRIYKYNAPQMLVKANENYVANNGVIDFGTSDSTQERNLSINNDSEFLLMFPNINKNFISITGEHYYDFKLDTPDLDFLNKSQTSNSNITFRPSGSGKRNAKLTILNNSRNAVYSINLTGFGQVKDLAIIDAWPNPTSDRFNVLYKDKYIGQITVIVLNSSGDTVWFTQYYKNAEIIRLESLPVLLYQPPGLYVIYIGKGDGTYITTKIVKQ